MVNLILVCWENAVPQQLSETNKVFHQRNAVWVDLDEKRGGNLSF
jgi:hypothetical protein